MNGIVHLYRRIDRVQGTNWFRIAASVVAIALVGALVAWIMSLDPASSSSLRGGGFKVPRFLTASDSAPFWVGAIVAAWLLLIIWLDLALTFVLITAGVGLVSLPLLMSGNADWALAAAGFGLLTFTFMVLIRGLLALFAQPNQILAIAHTVIKESVRLKVSVAFILILLIVLPLIPFLVETEQALRYRIQSFIGYSMGATFYFAAFMTIFLACGTISFEIRDRQIWQLMTKPVSRINYLIGKWLGIVCVNLVLLIVTGVSIFTFVQHMRFQTAANFEDAERVETEVLVARVGSRVYLEPIDPDVVRDAARKRINDSFTLRQEIESGDRDEYDVMRELIAEIRKERVLQQRTIELGEKKRYQFHGLGAARDGVYPLHLRYQIHYGEEDTHENNPITFLFFKDNIPVSVPMTERYVPTMSHYLKIPPEVIDEEGTVTLEIANGLILNDLSVYSPPQIRYSINFDPEDLEILYVAGGFEMNYIRAMSITWMKLAFIAMVGLACATVLSFPVAVMMTFTVFLAAIIGPFLAVSLDQFYVQEWYRLDKWLIKGIATMLVFLFEPFGQTNPSQRLVEGRLIPWWAVLRAIGLLGVAWSGVALAIGYLGFKDRELAIYSGHG